LNLTSFSNHNDTRDKIKSTTNQKRSGNTAMHSLIKPCDVIYELSLTCAALRRELSRILRSLRDHV
jgi:hypothetical protein